MQIKPILFVSLVLALFTSIQESSASFTTQIEDNTITIIKNQDIPTYWQKYEVNNPLIWDYFEGSVPINSTYSAYVTTQIEFSYAVRSKLNETKCTFSFITEHSDAIPYVNKKKSWVKSNETNDSSLKHENGHLKIAYIYAQKLKNELNALDLQIFSCSGNDLTQREQNIKNASQLMIEKVWKDVYSMWNFTDTDYDYETNHNKNSIQQERWNHILDVMTNDPSMELTNVKLLVPEKPIITSYSIQTKQCEFFDFSDYCAPTFPELLLNVMIGLVVGITISLYFYKKEQRDRQRIDTIIEGLEKTKNKRYKYIMSSLEEYLPDIRVLCESRNEKLELLSKNTNDSATKSSLVANLHFLESDVKHLEFLLNTQTDVLYPVQTERFKIVIDLLKVILDVHKQSYDYKIHLRSLFAEIDKLEELTTNVKDWRDLPIE